MGRLVKNNLHIETFSYNLAFNYIYAIFDKLLLNQIYVCFPYREQTLKPVSYYSSTAENNKKYVDSSGIRTLGFETAAPATELSSQPVIGGEPYPTMAEKGHDL
jgi:hypothetical protein